MSHCISYFVVVAAVAYIMFAANRLGRKKTETCLHIRACGDTDTVIVIFACIHTRACGELVIP